MKITKTMQYINVDGDWLDKSQDVEDGDTVVIADAGIQRDSRYTNEDGSAKKEYVFKVKVGDKELNARFNGKSRDALIDAFGDETKDWVGKEVTVRIKKDTIGGKKVIIAYFVTPEWDFDEYGELFNTADQAPVEGTIEI